MIRSKLMQQLLRWLIALLGAGLGAALALGAQQLYRAVAPDGALPLGLVITVYIGAALVCGGVMYLFSPNIISLCVEAGTALEKRLDRMTFGQVVSCTGGLIAGLVIAALISQIYTFMGESMFTAVLSAITYLLLGAIGLTLGWVRASDVTALMERVPARLNRRHRKAEDDHLRPKLLDTSVLIDGRILDVFRAGFLEGEAVVPAFILNELMHIADSADAAKRARGKRGLSILEAVQQAGSPPLRTPDTDYPDLQAADVKLLRLAQDMDGIIITCDASLHKAAAVSGVTAWNLNELASALRTTVTQGEEITVQVVKEGREPGQGVGYLPDGTMVVIDGGRPHLNTAIPVTVANVVQTTAGRMIFAKVK